MEFTEPSLKGIVVCKPTTYFDTRGYFVETFRENLLEEFLDQKINFCQDNEAFSEKGVLRGLHYQSAPYEQSKLIRVVSGKIWDVVVDIRKDSHTFGMHFGIELSAENKTQLFVPKGFAHGYVALERSWVVYKVDNYYNATADAGIFYNDQHLMIDWKFCEESLIISEKDKKMPDFMTAMDI